MQLTNNNNNNNKKIQANQNLQFQFMANQMATPPFRLGAMFASMFPLHPFGLMTLKPPQTTMQLTTVQR